MGLVNLKKGFSLAIGNIRTEKFPKSFVHVLKLTSAKPGAIKTKTS
jgi:hypothetical protein